MIRTLEILTPEQVTIQYELAGVGSRGVAAALDSLLQLAIFLLLVLLLQALMQSKLISPWSEWDRPVLITLLTLGFFIILWGYHILFETLWSGQTPGKRYMGLRVITDGGYPVDFRAVFVRNLLRAVDALPIYGVGFTVALLHPRYQRLGDMAAGTLVVHHGNEDATRRAPGLGEALVFRLLDPAVVSRIAHLTREEYRMVQLFLERRADLTPELQGQFAHTLAARLMEKLAYHAPELGMDDLRWLEEVDLAYRTRLLDAPPSIPLTPALSPTPPTTDVPPAVDQRKW